MDLSDYIREYLCQVTQFLEYVEDAIVSPEQTDFDVLLKKVEQIRSYTPFIEKLLGINRKDPHEIRKNTLASKAHSLSQKSRSHDTEVDRRKQGPAKSTRRGSSKARGSRR